MDGRNDGFVDGFRFDCLVGCLLGWRNGCCDGWDIGCDDGFIFGLELGCVDGRRYG